MKQHHLATTIQASYCTLNELTDQTKCVWIVFHGQGMLAQYFIKKFEGLDSAEHFVIAPQGLSKYYLEGYTGRVGACWMTKEDRLTEIDNQQSYLKAVVEQELGDFRTEKLILFGFSQGAATACRFGAFSGIRFHQLVLWAGLFPDDLPKEAVDHWSSDLDITYFFADDDPFMRPGLKEMQQQLIERAVGRTPRTVEYTGGHRVISELLAEI
ncbi:MAG: alpha/beta hydrolase [Cyclobacteriaceae bacterium]